MDVKTSTTPRASEERTRPASLQIANDKGSSSFGGFFNKRKLANVNIPSSAQIAQATSRPTTPIQNTDFSFLTGSTPDAVPRSPQSARSATLHDSIPRSSSTTNLSGTSSRAHYDDYVGLRKNVADSNKKIDGLTKELADLKRGKLEVEAELENLSQALFEEANKMVADERKKRAEVEESLKEVKDEREALRQTIKVLGGGAPEPEVEPEKVVEEREMEDEKEDDSFSPRDLDVHYEALRRSIAHVKDGTDGEAPINVPPTIEESDADDTVSEKLDRSPVAQMVMPPSPVVAAPLMSDPWAVPSLTSTAPMLGPGPERNEWAPTTSSSPNSGVEDLDRLMERLQQDMEDA